MPKNVQITIQLHSFHMPARLCSKSFRLGLQHYMNRDMNRELTDVQTGFRTGRWTRDQIANIFWITEKAREFPPPPKKSTVSLTMPKHLIVWITTKCGIFLMRWEYQTTLPASWETCMQDKQQQNWTWNNRLVQNCERSTLRLYIATLLI